MEESLTTRIMCGRHVESVVAPKPLQVEDPIASVQTAKVMAFKTPWTGVSANHVPGFERLMSQNNRQGRSGTLAVPVKLGCPPNRGMNSSASRL
jgi:hypothetical protein